MGEKPGVAAPIAKPGVGGTNAFPFDARGVAMVPGDTMGVAPAFSGKAMLVGAPGRTRPGAGAGATTSSVLLCASSRLISSSSSEAKRLRSTHFPRLTMVENVRPFKINGWIPRRKLTPLIVPEHNLL